jgi:hypothetical protein
MYQKFAKSTLLFFIELLTAISVIACRVPIFYFGVAPQALLILYTYSIFVNALFKSMAVNELFKLFAPLSSKITARRVNIMHVMLFVSNSACLGGILGYHIVFSFPTQDHPIARWFRFGSVINTYILAIFTGAVHIIMAILLRNHSRKSKKKLPDQKERERKLFWWLTAMLCLYVVSFALYISGVIVDGPARSNRNRVYQSLAQIYLCGNVVKGVMNPNLFNAIVNVRFPTSNSASKPVRLSNPTNNDDATSKFHSPNFDRPSIATARMSGS